MPVEVAFTDDPAAVLTRARASLASQPVLHNIILTLLRERVGHREPGRYWVASDGDAVVGIVFQSPLTMRACLSVMNPTTVAAVVAAIATEGADLPGIHGEASTAAHFAGAWTERHDSAAIPFQGQRLYEAVEVQQGTAVSGHLRRAVAEDRDLVVAWMRGFQADIGEPGNDSERMVDRALAAGQFWLWDDGEPVSMACHSSVVEGVVRVRAAYTPPATRGRGYAGACIGALTQQLLEGGYRCMLYTDLGNPISNRIFRRIGYRAVAEALRYRFDGGQPERAARPA